MKLFSAERSLRDDKIFFWQILIYLGVFGATFDFFNLGSNKIVIGIQKGHPRKNLENLGNFRGF